MNELDLQGGYLLNFLCSADGLGYKEVTANTVSEDYVIESWQTEGDSEEATINGDTMSATGSSIWHDRSYSKQYPEDVYYSDVYCSYRWSASRANI